MGGSVDRITVLPIDMRDEAEAKKMFESVRKKRKFDLKGVYGTRKTTP